MYVKKFTSFYQVLKKMHTKGNWFVVYASRCMCYVEVSQVWRVCWLVNREKHEQQHRPALHKVHTLSLCSSIFDSCVCLSRGPIYKISYDYLTIMPKLRSTYNGRLIYCTAYEECKAFLR